MHTIIYKVKEIDKGILSIMAKPISGEWIEEEFNHFKTQGINYIISLLEENEAYELGLKMEHALCAKNNIIFERFPIKDRGVPNLQRAKILVKKVLIEIKNGQHVVIHCRAGIGRTGIIAAAILKESGMMTHAALELISHSRGINVPDTKEQIDWLTQY